MWTCAEIFLILSKWPQIFNWLLSFDILHRIQLTANVCWIWYINIITFFRNPFALIKNIHTEKNNKMLIYRKFELFLVQHFFSPLSVILWTTRLSFYVNIPTFNYFWKGLLYGSNKWKLSTQLNYLLYWSSDGLVLPNWFWRILLVTQFPD